MSAPAQTLSQHRSGGPRGGRQLAASLLAIVVLVAGCKSGSSDHAPSREKQQVDTLRGLPFGDAAIGVAAEMLTRVGVGLHDDNTEVTSGKPIRLTRWQVRNLAAEAANGGGVPGEVLDAVAPAAKGAPPLAFLVAAWVKSYDSANAKFARELMGDQDWRLAEQISFPNLVLTLFLADALAGVNKSASPAPRAIALAAMTLAGPCTFAATFIQNAIADVAKALKVSTDGGGFLGFLGTIWNVAVDLAAAVVTGLVNAITKPVVDRIADIFGIVAVIAQVSSFLVKWRADVRTDPSHNRFGVDSEVITGQAQLVVAQNQLPIPDFVLDCADAVKVDLRNAGSAAGSKVIWQERNTGRADLSTRTGADNVLAQDKTARYRYQTGQESSELAKSPDSETFALIVSASIERNDVQKARELFTKLLIDRLPDEVRGIVQNLAQPLIDAADKQLAAITAVRATGRVFITFHTPSKATPKPGGSTPSIPRAIIPADCPIEKVAGFGYQLYQRDDVRPGWFSCFYAPPSLALIISVGPFAEGEQDTRFPGVSAIDIPGADAAWHGEKEYGYGSFVLVKVGDRMLEVQLDHEDPHTAIAIAKTVLGIG